MNASMLFQPIEIIEAKEKEIENLKVYKTFDEIEDTGKNFNEMGNHTERKT